MRITPNSLTVNQALSSSNEQYMIPSYQRRYSWNRTQVQDLIDDISYLEGSDTHLMGSIVCLIGDHTAGINSLDLVDGQQRLTTIVILLECIREEMETRGSSEVAADLSRLLMARDANGAQEPKLRLETMDQTDFEALLTHKQHHRPRNRRLAEVFAFARQWAADSETQDLLQFQYRIRNQALVIRLDVGAAKDAFKLFETINNRGLRLSPTDIIKNFVLGNAARFDVEKLKAARIAWADLLVRLDGINPDVFFRYYLMTQIGRRLTRSEVVPTFKNFFMQRVIEAQKLPDRHQYEAEDDDEDEEDEQAITETSETGDEEPTREPDLAVRVADLPFIDFLGRMVRYASIFASLLNCETGVAKIDRRLRNLKMIKAVQTYGFLTHLRAKGCDDKAFAQILKLTESFVLRRHTCRERANETEALFANLSGIDVSHALTTVRTAYRRLCPDDTIFREEFSRTRYVSNIIDRARYCLEQFEISKHGNHEELQVLGAEDVHVEHIIPQKIKTKRSRSVYGDWPEYLGEGAVKRHAEYVCRIGNLTLFAGELNISASNNPFRRKKPAYKASTLLLTKEVAEMKAFRFSQVEKRSAELAELAVKLWPAP